MQTLPNRASPTITIALANIETSRLTLMFMVQSTVTLALASRLHVLTKDVAAEAAPMTLSKV